MKLLRNIWIAFDQFKLLRYLLHATMRLHYLGLSPLLCLVGKWNLSNETFETNKRLLIFALKVDKNSSVYSSLYVIFESYSSSFWQIERDSFFPELAGKQVLLLYFIKIARSRIILGYKILCLDPSSNYLPCFLLPIFNNICHIKGCSDDRSGKIFSFSWFTLLIMGLSYLLYIYINVYY